MPTITAAEAKKRLRRTIDFARCEETESDERLARIDLRLVNRELSPFGYAIEAASYAGKRYTPLKGATPLAGAGNLTWCTKLILIDLGIPVQKHRRGFFETEFAKARREYRRRMDAKLLLGETM